MAAFGGNEALVTLLLSHGADARAQGGDLGTVLQMAIYSRSLSIVKMFLNSFPSPDANLGKGDFGTTPLQLAVLLKDIEILSLLLSHRPDLTYQGGRADTNMTTSFGITPLHQALYLGWGTGIDALVRHGANPQLFDLYGHTCLDWALQDTDLFRRLAGKETYRPTSHVIQKRLLTESVRNLVTTLSQNSDRQDGRRNRLPLLRTLLVEIKRRRGSKDEFRTADQERLLQARTKTQHPMPQMRRRGHHWQPLRMPHVRGLGPLQQSHEPVRFQVSGSKMQETPIPQSPRAAVEGIWERKGE